MARQVSRVARTDTDSLGHGLTREKFGHGGTKFKDRSQNLWIDGLGDFGFVEGGFYQLTNR